MDSADRITLVWDWNGTLLDDVAAAVAALNRLLASRHAPPVTRARYRARFGFPVRPFYAELGIDLAHEDWDRICVDFHDFFADEPTALRPDATAALEHARAAGCAQVILSALREDLLRAAVANAGIADFFEILAGVDNLDGCSKLARGRALVRKSLTGRRLAFIGDTLHDAEVARELGGSCVLVDCGHQTRERLLTAGCPVVATLDAAVERALTMR